MKIPPTAEKTSAESNCLNTRGIRKTIDANEATASVAYALSEVIAIYPITPASPMGEHSDAWSAAGRGNYWGTVPEVVEMQSEGGAAGVVHGAVQTGSLATTFTSSQGLLLMIPVMYKIAGELSPVVIHVAARSLAAQGLSIFGDHSDVMAARATGWGMLCASTVQEAADFALITHAVALKGRIPFMHFFDGFRTSHEIATIQPVGRAEIEALIDETWVDAHRARALTPDHPVLRGTAQNPDVYFQARETVNPRYAASPTLVQKTMDHLARVTGRQYSIFEYHGAADAWRVVVLMGSGCDAAHETVDWLMEQGEKVGVLKVRLFRPFAASAFAAALPATVQSVAVLDRTKEPGCAGEPLYLDCLAALSEAGRTGVRVLGGRYGLSSKEFTPAMVKSVFEHLATTRPKNHFTVGIDDDLGGTSIEFDPKFSVESEDTFRAVFYGLGSDGTVGANKETIKIIGENTEYFAQGYFVYDSKKSGATTVSHLRFGKHPIRSSYLIERANFVACHQWQFVERYPVAEVLDHGATFLLNSPYPAESVWDHLPAVMQQVLVERKARLFVIDAHRVARETHMAGRINTIMQTCFFAISGVLPRDEAMESIRQSIRKSYGRKGEELVRMNLAAVERACDELHEVPVPVEATGQISQRPPVPAIAPEFVRNVLGPMLGGCGDHLPVSALPEDGTYPTATSRWEKRNLASEVPVWDPDICIQCGKCVMVCPHAVVRSKVFEESLVSDAPPDFAIREARLPDWKGLHYTIQISVEDCTGCGICVDVCPAKNKSFPELRAINMHPVADVREQEIAHWNYFQTIPDLDRALVGTGSVRAQQVQRPLFEFPGACAGCGETPYLKLISQLFGDRMVIANATGCSSIYGGNLPTTPWAVDDHERGPAWSNSLFENNAEFGLGFRISLDRQHAFARELVRELALQIGDVLVDGLLDGEQRTEADLHDQRERVAELKYRLNHIPGESAKRLLPIADALVRRSVWIVGGDGWANDIGFGGLDHVLASGRDVNVLVLDTEVYSNTGGQMSKATPRAAVAKFATAGKPGRKKDLGLITMQNGGVYVASIAMGAKDEHTLKALIEAEAYRGPSLIIAYSHCIAHGMNLTTGMHHQKAAVDSGQWLLYRYNPDRTDAGLNPLVLDSGAPRIPVEQYLETESRFTGLTKSRPEAAHKLFEQAQADVDTRRDLYERMAATRPPADNATGGSQ